MSLNSGGTGFMKTTKCAGKRKAAAGTKLAVAESWRRCPRSKVRNQSTMNYDGNLQLARRTLDEQPSDEEGGEGHLPPSMRTEELYLVAAGFSSPLAFSLASVFFTSPLAF